MPMKHRGRTLALALLAACGGGATAPTPPPPRFTASMLLGTWEQAEPCPTSVPHYRFTFDSLVGFASVTGSGFWQTCDGKGAFGTASALLFSGDSVRLVIDFLLPSPSCNTVPAFHAVFLDTTNLGGLTYCAEFTSQGMGSTALTGTSVLMSNEVEHLTRIQ